MKKKTKCYIYTRVSIAIQVDGYSLDAQKDRLMQGYGVNLICVLEDLRYKNCTANISSKSRYNPHVFTEQGLYMLMTVLKGPLIQTWQKFMGMKPKILKGRLRITLPNLKAMILCLN